MGEIAKINPEYGGITYARLERSGTNVPVASYADAGTPILSTGPDGRATLSAAFVAVN
jgi:hypothetical protein